MDETYPSGHYASPHPGDGPSGPSHSGFFHSLRRSGWYRAEIRTVGGVCSGIAAKTGWDLALVRGLSVIACIFAPPLLALYGFAWALLPEQRDGRIHAEELVAGRLDAAQLGAGLLMFVGLTSFVPVSLNFSAGSPLAFFASLGTFGILALVVIVVVALLVGSSARSAPAQPFVGAAPQRPAPQGNGADAGFAAPGRPASGPSAQFSTPVPPSAPSFAPQSADWRSMGGPQAVPTPPPVQGARVPYSPTGPAAHSMPRTAPSPMPPAPPQGRAPYTPSAVWTPPVPVPVNHVSRRSNLLVTGLIVIVMAGTFLAMYLIGRGFFFSDYMPADVVNAGLIGAGACLLTVGLALVIASIRGKGAGWFIALSLIGCFLALPTALVGLSATYDSSASDHLVVDETPYSYDWTSDAVSGSILGQAHLDLTAAPSGAVKDIYVDASVYDLSISARADQPLRIVCTREIDDVVAAYWSGPATQDENAPSAADWVARLRSCADVTESAAPGVSTQSSTWSSEQGITIHVDTWLTSFIYSEDAPPLESDAAAESAEDAAPDSKQSAESAQSAAPAHDLQPLSDSAHDENRSL